MRRLLAGLAPLAAVLVALTSACDSNPPDRVLSVGATGVVVGGSFVDRNGNGTYETSDGLVAGVKISLAWASGGAAVASGVTDASGTLVLRDVPVGRYRVTVDATAVGDSLAVTRVDSSIVTVARGDTARAIVALGYPPATIAAARAMTLGRKVQVQGVALNAWAAFGDSSVAIADATGTLRALRVKPANIQVGDSVRLTGTVSVANGQPVLTSVDPQIVASGGTSPAPTVLTTKAASGASGGTLDAALVRITGATLLSLRVDADGSVVATVDDGSGSLDVALPPRSAVSPPSSFVPGAIVDVTGILVPAVGQAAWRLQPRASAEIVAKYPIATVAEIRHMTVGRIVQVEGIALNGWSTFADSSVHVVDPTGSLRTIRVAPVSLFAGDSVRIAGIVAMRDGQVVLTGAVATVLATGRPVPSPRALNTATAANASNGALDAALVSINGGVVQDTAHDPAGNFHVRVNDTSGLLEVVLDRALGLALTKFVPNATLDATGLLVPITGGAYWVLKPRGSNDVLVR